MTDLKEFLNKYEKLLPMSKHIPTSESELRAAEFLIGQAHIASHRHTFSQEKIRCLSVQNAVYAQELAKGTGKTMTENKVIAEASAEYEKAREDLERVENDLNYLKAYYDIFQNAHLFYRQMARAQGSMYE